MADISKDVPVTRTTSTKQDTEQSMYMPNQTTSEVIDKFPAQPTPYGQLSGHRVVEATTTYGSDTVTAKKDIADNMNISEARTLQLRIEGTTDRGSRLESHVVTVGFRPDNDGVWLSTNISDKATLYIARSGQTIDSPKLAKSLNDTFMESLASRSISPAESAALAKLVMDTVDEVQAVAKGNADQSVKAGKIR